MLIKFLGVGMKKFFLFLVLIGLLTSCSNNVKIVRKDLDPKKGFYVVSSEEFLMREPTTDIPFRLYAQYNYEKKLKGERFIFGIKFLGGYLPGIQSVKISIDGYKQQCKLTRFPVPDVQGVQGITETVYFVVPEELVEEIIRTKKAYFEIKANRDFRFFFPTYAIDVLKDFYNKVLDEG